MAESLHNYGIKDGFSCLAPAIRAASGRGFISKRLILREKTGPQILSWCVSWMAFTSEVRV